MHKVQCTLETGQLDVSWQATSVPGSEGSPEQEPAPASSPAQGSGSALFGFAERNNPRRAFLFVSRVLGRHVPVSPARMRNAFATLADSVPADLPGPVLMTGMAETAVGLGAGVHDAYLARTGRQDVVFLSTTRADFPTPLLALFDESHSHASAQRVYQPQHAEDRTLLASARSLVMVDDEASSGNTFRNLSDALLRAGVDALQCIHTAVLTDWTGRVALRSTDTDSDSSPASLAETNSGPVWSQSALISGHYQWTPAAHAPVRTLPDADHPRQAAFAPLPREDDARLGRSCRSDAICPPALSAALKNVRGRIHVVGTGEHVWEPFLWAEALEKSGHEVRFSATTRSPILPGHEIRRGLVFADHEGLGITSYLYNLDPAEASRIIVCVDTAREAVDPSLLEALNADLVVGEHFYDRAELAALRGPVAAADAFVATDAQSQQLSDQVLSGASGHTAHPAAHLASVRHTSLRRVVFTDLDDTLFQTLRKISPPLREQSVQVTQAANGHHSFMLPVQRALCEWMGQDHSIPVTARGSEAYGRVSLAFDGPAVVANGAVILTQGGLPDLQWQARMNSVLTSVRDVLDDLPETILALAASCGIAIRTWLVQEPGCGGVYAVAKAENDPSGAVLEALVPALTARLKCEPVETRSEHAWGLHLNGNNLALLPPGVSKAAAVAHLLSEWCGKGDVLSIGVGDSRSDLEFMRLCDVWMTPSHSQIDAMLGNTTEALPDTTQGHAGGYCPPTRFSGSYTADDVHFLLHPVTVEQAADLFHEPEDKERLIQTGQRHYSEMISAEFAPTEAYQAIFERTLVRHAARMGEDMAALVIAVAQRISGPITLCSLVRAGVPIGVLLQRGLRALGRDVTHFGISIIRDRGIDPVALGHIRARRPSAGVVFVDGWTGKGAIADELERTLAMEWPDLPVRLVVLADPAGRAWLSAGVEDWLIPSGILGGTVSGLVSRSILNDSLTGPQDFHATIMLDHLRAHDVSRRFVDEVGQHMLASLFTPGSRDPMTEFDSTDGREAFDAGRSALAQRVAERQAVTAADARRDDARQAAQRVVDRLAQEFGILNRNRIKPGIAEATRAVLRRAPDRILVGGEQNDPDLAGLRHLAEQVSVPVEWRGDALYPYRAITLIGDRQS